MRKNSGHFAQLPLIQLYQRFNTFYDMQSDAQSLMF